jgi:hypothetical protein
MMHLRAHETPTINLEVLEFVLHVFLLDLIPSFLTLYGPNKGILINFVIGAMIKAKVLMKHL